MSFDPETLNPGIRRTVMKMREWGFETCDSGDGDAREFGCDPGSPYVYATTLPARMVLEANRLHRLAQEHFGVSFDVIDGQDAEQAPNVQASYHPECNLAIISLLNVRDADWVQDE